MFCWVSEPQEQHRLCHLPAAGHSPPAAFNTTVRAEWHREKKGKGIWRSLRSIRNYVCILLSAQTLLLSSLPEKHLILLFQSAHQQTTAQPLLCPCSRGFPLTEVVEMNPAVLWCSPLSWESRHCSAPQFFCSRSLLPSTSK